MNGSGRWVGILGAVSLATVAMGIGPAAQAADDPYDGRWHYAVTPYLWLPNINSTLAFEMPPGQGSSAESSIGPNDYLENLNLALMIRGEARKGRWAVVADLIQLNFSDEDSTLKSVEGGGGRVAIPRDLNLDTETSFKGSALMLAVSYTVAQSDAATVDLLGGLRYLGIRASLDWDLSAAVSGSGFTVERSGRVSENEGLVDAIVGVRGKFRLCGSQWFVPYYLDIGTGESSLTWQAMAGVGYALDWGEALMSYRHLSYDQGGDPFVQDLRFSGPALGFTFRF